MLPSKSSQTNNSTKSLLSPPKSLSVTPSLSHKKSTKTPKEKRRSSKIDGNGGSPSIGSGTQWYTTEETNGGGTTPPVFELRQELTPKRPLRSEVEKEKRLSRPSSGQFSRPNSMSVTIRAASSSGTSSNRDSVG